MKAVTIWFQNGDGTWIKPNPTDRSDVSHLLDSNPDTFFYIAPSIVDVNKCPITESSIPGAAVQTLVIQFPTQKCVRSIQLDWEHFSIPQLTSIEIRENISDEAPVWKQIQGMSGFMMGRCDRDRTDIWDLVSGNHRILSGGEQMVRMIAWN